MVSLGKTHCSISNFNYYSNYVIQTSFNGMAPYLKTFYERDRFLFEIKLVDGLFAEKNRPWLKFFNHGVEYFQGKPGSC